MMVGSGNAGRSSAGGQEVHPAFLEGGGELGRLVQAFPWQQTSLGPIDSWPQSLRTATSLLLRSPVPIVMLWGEAGFMIYNDAYSKFAGERHPKLLGSKVREGWPEVADFNDHVMKTGLAGGTLSFKDQELVLHRHGKPEPAWMDLDYSPVLDESGRPAGVLAIVVETTERKALQERERFLLTLSDTVRDLIDPVAVASAAAELLGRHLGVGRAGYAEVDAARQTVTVARDWCAGSMPSLAGESRLLDGFGPGVIAELKAGRTLVIEDFRTDARAGDGDADTWESIDTRALVVVPLLRSGGLRAIFYLHEPSPRAWSPNDIDLACLTAERTWDAAERARVETRLRDSRDRLAMETQALETLNGIGAQIAAELDLEKLVQRVVDAGVELTGASFGAFFYNVVDEAGERYTLYSLSGADRGAFEKLGLPRATSVFAPTFRGEGVIRSPDILEDPRYGQNPPNKGMPKGHLPVRSYLAVPVVSRSGEVIGGLFFGHVRPGMFTERSERVMTGLAAQTAIAIDNARLFDAVHQANTQLEERVKARTAELELAHERLHQSQKMEAVGQLTGGIAHDFNNMLAVIMGSLELLKRRVGDADPRAQRYTEAAMDGARRAAVLTQRLLAFSRQQPLRPEPIDANKLVAGMCDLLRRALGADVLLETVLDGALWCTHADPNQLENVILNLAVNARDAMADGGRMTIATHNAHLDGHDPDSRLGVPLGQYVMIAVTDTGVGMNEEVIAKAFDPFFTTKGVGKGTGLGLSQVYGFVKQTGGHVKIFSEVGRGTTVKVYLPRFAGAAEDEARVQRAGEVPLGERQEVVLVVEDEPAVRQFSIDAFTELGYRVLHADGAAAALRQLEAHPGIALLFTDVVMPEVNGAKLAEEVRRRWPAVKILFTTGYPRNAVGRNGVLDAGVEMIGKPYTLEALARKVREILEG
ncbi:PAS domain S-box-containing protein [Variovorax boronicumulans]|uniref:GAF domain-containing protein n=1 Tax=Variovorax boronicumulans TaxID=436515 RepID=UPI0024740AD2|nr:GAF domain-containing protein [Variovorax boronicumulans]MDH6166156.1 PAS domain S-box-containing protein [Variovorax boronicumulans]